MRVWLIHKQKNGSEINKVRKNLDHLEITDSR
jgi:hypothetical protein